MRDNSAAHFENPPFAERVARRTGAATHVSNVWNPHVAGCSMVPHQENYFTSSDPHHDTLGEGCQVRVAATQFFFAISYKSSRAAHSAEEHLANNQGQKLLRQQRRMFKHVKTCQDTT